MRAAIYARFSSEMQRDASINDQIRNCRTYAARQGWQVEGACIFEDRAITGSVTNRPGYQAMQQAAKERQFDVLIVDDLSRLGRDSAEVQMVQKRLKFRDIGLVSIADGINTIDNPQSSGLIMGLKAAMNEEYLRDLAEKTRRGLEGRVLAGFSPGGLPYGYTSEPDYGDPCRMDRYGQPVPIGHRRVIVPEQAEVVVRIFELYAEGCSSRRIAEVLNSEGVPPPGQRWKNRERIAAETWSLSAIQGDRKRGLGILNNEAYLGRIIWNKFEWRKDPDGHGSSDGRARRVPIMRPREEWVTTEAPELRIVSGELWRRVREAQARRSREPGTSGKRPVDGRHQYLLSGLLTCGECGARLAVRNRHGYGCMTRANRGSQACSNSSVVNRAALEAAVLAALRDELYGQGLVSQLTGMVRDALLRIGEQRDATAERRTSKDRLASLEAEIGRLAASISRCEGEGRSLAAEHLERSLEALLTEKQRLEAVTTVAEPGLLDKIHQILPSLPDMVQRHLHHLDDLAEGPQVRYMKSAMADLVDGIEVRPGQTEEGRPCHVVRVRGALDRALRLLARTRQMSVVAGAGFVGEKKTRLRRWIVETVFRMPYRLVETASRARRMVAEEAPKGPKGREVAGW